MSKVREALTTPELIKQYLFGTDVTSDWQVGSPIVYKGEWQGKAYEDKGRTRVTITQDNNATEGEKSESERNWNMVLGGLKRRLEQKL